MKLTIKDWDIIKSEIEDELVAVTLPSVKFEIMDFPASGTKRYTDNWSWSDLKLIIKVSLEPNETLSSKWDGFSLGKKRTVYEIKHSNNTYRLVNAHVDHINEIKLGDDSDGLLLTVKFDEAYTLE